MVPSSKSADTCGTLCKYMVVWSIYLLMFAIVMNFVDWISTITKI